MSNGGRKEVGSRVVREEYVDFHRVCGRVSVLMASPKSEKEALGQKGRSRRSDLLRFRLGREQTGNVIMNYDS